MPIPRSCRPARLTLSPEAHGGAPQKAAQPQAAQLKAFLSLP